MKKYPIIVIKGRLLLGDYYYWSEGFLSNADNALVIEAKDDIIFGANKNDIKENDVWIDSLKDIILHDLVAFSDKDITENPLDEINKLVEIQQKNK